MGKTVSASAKAMKAAPAMKAMKTVNASAKAMKAAPAMKAMKTVSAVAKAMKAAPAMKAMKKYCWGKMTDACASSGVWLSPHSRQAWVAESIEVFRRGTASCLQTQQCVPTA